MSLVDYDASSSDEDDNAPIKKPQTTSLNPQPSTRPQNNSEPYQRPQSSNPLPAEPAIEKLPDASELLSSAGFTSSSVLSGGGGDHSSLVAAAVAQSESRKRGLAGSTSSLPPRSSKVPKGASLPHSKNVPDTAGRALVPPQLRGRSNVVTEDITKLFVKKQAEAAKSRVPQVGDS